MYKSAISLAFLGISSLTTTSAGAVEIRFTELDEKHRVTEQMTGSDLEIARSAELALQATPFRHRPDLVYDETWVADIGTLLTRDLDDDGYYTGFSLSIDVDTHRAHHEIYLAINTRNSNGTISPLYRTSDFTIYGDAYSDELQVDIDLVNSYPADSYNLLIDVFDAWDDRLLDTVADQQFSNLGQLPLESEDLDIAPARPVIPANDQGEEPVRNIRVVEHAGSASLWWLAGLALLACRGRREPR